jgi:hypothetical protein
MPYQTDLIGLQDSSLGISPNYAESYEKVVLNFSAYPNVNLVKGKLPKSLDEFSLNNIGFLHIGFQHTNKLFNDIAKRLKFNILTTATGQGIAIKH